jgi:hypothetical protein
LFFERFYVQEYTLFFFFNMTIDRLILNFQLYRDQIFDTLFASIEKDSTMNGLPQKSLHLFSHEDSIVPAEASMQAMYLYENPKMMIRDGDHDPDDRAVDQVLKALKNSWSKKFSPPLILEG